MEPVNAKSISFSRQVQELRKILAEPNALARKQQYLFTHRFNVTNFTRMFQELHASLSCFFARNKKLLNQPHESYGDSLQPCPPINQNICIIQSSAEKKAFRNNLITQNVSVPPPFKGWNRYVIIAGITRRPKIFSAHQKMQG